MVSIAQVENVLLPWVGTQLLKVLRTECETWARMLNAPTKAEAFSILSDRLSGNIYKAVRQATGGTFMVKPDGYEPVRMRADDFNRIGDEMMYLKFSDMKVTLENLNSIQAYALSSPSLSALRALYVDFSPLETEEERARIKQLITQIYPAYCYQSWLY